MTNLLNTSIISKRQNPVTAELIEYLPWSCSRGKVIAVDFDGCLCADEYPECGRPNNKLIHLLVMFRRAGGKLILWTCRSGALLDDAVDWCYKHGLVFDAVNDNLEQWKERYGGDTRKVYADLYIDDKVCNSDIWWR